MHLALRLRKEKPTERAKCFVKLGLGVGKLQNRDTVKTQWGRSEEQGARHPRLGPEMVDRFGPFLRPSASSFLQPASPETARGPLRGSLFPPREPFAAQTWKPRP